MGKPKKELPSDDDDAIFAQRAIELKGASGSRHVSFFFRHDTPGDDAFALPSGLVAGIAVAPTESVSPPMMTSDSPLSPHVLPIP